jgi:tetratricopeptide (TPR) repeat protein/DNA-binding CsgD family transcriptional regulator
MLRYLYKAPPLPIFGFRNVFFTILILFIHNPGNLSADTDFDSLFSMIRTDAKLAGKQFETALNESISLKDKALATYGLAISYNYVGEIDTALFLFDQAFARFDSAGLDSMAFESIFESGINCRRSGRYIKALENYERARDYAERKGMQILEGDAINAMGVAHYGQGETVKALEYYLEALSIFEEHGMEEKMGKSYNNIGVIYKISSNHDKAIEYYYKSIEIKRKYGIIHALDPPYFNINDLYHVKGEYEKALQTTREAMQIAKEHDIDWWIQSCHYMLVNDFHALNQADSMKKHVDIYRSLANDPYYQAISDELEAEYHNLIGNHDRTLELAKKAILFFRSDGDLLHLNRCMTLYAQSLSKLGYYDRAIDTLNVIKRNAEERKDNARVLNTLLSLSEIYEAGGNYIEALKWAREYSLRRQSVYNESRASIIGGLEAEMRLRLKEKEKKILKKEAELQSAIIEKQNLIIWFAAFAIGLSLILAYLLYRSQKQKAGLAEAESRVNQEKARRVSEQLEYKNRELVNFALQIVYKNEFLTEVSSEIEKWYKNGLGQNVKVRDLFKKLKANSVLINNQKEFEAHVNSVHESFYAKLDKKYPELTANEKRLAALLRMRLSSKEISSITGISAKSVDMSRYRLRKKMALKSGEDLLEILNNL